MQTPSIALHGRISKCLRSRLFVLLLLFLTGLLARIWFLHEKENLYGDELTSVCLSLNQPGWGDSTFVPRHIYNGEGLRHAFFSDDIGGWEGLTTDLQALWKDNRDGSHASLYYMLLRCFVTGAPADMDSFIRRAGTLNLLCYTASFLLLFTLLRRMSEGDGNAPSCHRATAFILLLYALHPTAISSTVLAREYALAETLMLAWTLWCVGVWLRVHGAEALSTTGMQGALSGVQHSSTSGSGTSSTSIQLPSSPGFRTRAVGIILAACVLSAGYFNALFLCMTAGLLVLDSCLRDRYRPAFQYLGMGVMSLLVCLVMYPGFLGFLQDDRLHDVTQQGSAGGFMSNVQETLKAIVYYGIKYVVTPLGCVFLFLPILRFCIGRMRGQSYSEARDKNAQPHLRKSPESSRHAFGKLFAHLQNAFLSPRGFVLCGVVWAVLILYLTPFKYSRYLAPAIPLIVVVMGQYVWSWTNGKRIFKVSVPAVFALLWAAYTFSGIPVENLERCASYNWKSADARRVILYAPNAEESHSLKHFIPFLTDRQEAVILPDTADFARFAPASAPGDTLYIYGPQQCPELLRHPDCLGHEAFDPYIDIYRWKSF